MKKNFKQRVLPFMLATSIIFTAGCTSNKNTSSKNETNQTYVEEQKKFAIHTHYYVYYGNTTVIIRNCEVNDISIAYNAGLGGYDNRIDVSDANNNTILSSEHVDFITITNDTEEQYALELENYLIESGNGILFEDLFGKEKKLIKND